MSAPTNYKVHELSTIDAAGSRAFHSFSEREVVLLVNIKSAPTGGSPTLTFTIQSVDPVDEVTIVGPIATTGPLTGVGISTIRIPSISSAVLVSWVVGGSSPSFTDVNVSVFGKDAASTALVTTSGTEIGVGSSPIRVDSTGSTTQPISVTSLPLPTGAATESTLSSLASEDFATQSTLANILTELQDKTEPTDTQPVSAVSLPLPAGASTSSLQDAGNNYLTSIDQKFPLIGQATLASGIPVSIASNQTVIPVNDNGGSITVDASSWPLPTGASTEATLATRASESTLSSIKDTDGIKKITDGVQLQASSNEIGAVAQGTKAAGADAWPMVLYNSAGTPITVVDDAGVYRVAMSGKVQIIGSIPPPATNPAVINADTPLTVGLHDTTFTIPNGETFFLQGVVAGNEDPSKGAKVEVIFNNGTEHIISRMYFNGVTVSIGYADVSEARDGTSLVGNGTNTIIVRRSKYSGSDIAIDAVATGYTV